MVNNVVEICSVKDYMAAQSRKGKFSRYDLIVNYLFIEKYFENNKPKDFSYKLYSKIVKTRDRDAQPWKFVSLINSFEMKGYDKQYHLYMSRGYVTGGGKHRIACCLYFGVDEFPVIYREHYNEKKRNYTKKKMIKYGFKKYMPLLKATKNKIFTRLEI